MTVASGMQPGTRHSGFRGRAAALLATAALTLAACSAAPADPVTTTPDAAALTSTQQSGAPSSSAGSVAAGSATQPSTLPTDDPAAAASQSAAAASFSSALATATPAELDAQTSAWFETMCGGLAKVEPAGFDNDGDGTLSPIEQANYFRALSESFTATSQAATSLPPPTIDGGADLVTALSSSLATAGTDFGGLVDKATTSVDGPNGDIAGILQDASRSYIGIAYAPLVQSDPGVLKALHPLPSCAAVGW